MINEEQMGEHLGDLIRDANDALNSCVRVRAGREFEERAATLARMASEVYEAKPQAVGEYDVVESGSFRRGGAEIISGYAVFRHRRTGVKVLSLRGTANVGDQVFDAAQMVGAFGAHGQGYACGIIAGVANGFNQLLSSHVISAVVGHSLGGFLASILCSRAGLPGIAFQAPGATGYIGGGNKYMGTNTHPDFKVINVKFDLVGNNGNYNGKGHPGYRVYYVDLKRGFFDVTGRHSIDNLASYLARTAITNK